MESYHRQLSCYFLQGEICNQKMNLLQLTIEAGRV